MMNMYNAWNNALAGRLHLEKINILTYTTTAMHSRNVYEAHKVCNLQITR